ncbi:MAG TPA: glycoside hydrolase family 3 N-terminal domain-containing protein [Candidatus Deferrimicrobium sp.]|nr:glycoside hydrolase family 3 N-terminal domain-containing protein [Candidatus Deferrimicrobium sp.]
MTNPEEQIGQFFIVGFPGERPSRAFLKFIGDRHIGGVILFHENCRTHEIARENIRLLRSRFRATIPFIAVDQEGGRVCRLKGAPAEFRAAAEYGRANEREHFQEDYMRAAVFMESLGFNLNFAPVCDIFLNPSNLCLEGRCFGSDAERVVPFVEQAVSISRQAGLLSCLKHFPGLGAASGDPHHETPTADYDELVWDQQEMLPFVAGVKAGADMIMTTHLRVPRIDEQIATASRRIVSGMIRQRLMFDGPVITDDLLMSGAASLGTPGERAIAAFVAGHDLLLFGREFEKAAEAFEDFLDAVQEGEIPRERLSSSLGRVAGLKFKLDRLMIR